MPIQSRSRHQKPESEVPTVTHREAVKQERRACRVGAWICMNLDRGRAQRGRLGRDRRLPGHRCRRPPGGDLRVELLHGGMAADLNQGFLQLANGLLQAVQPLVGAASDVFPRLPLILLAVAGHAGLHSLVRWILQALWRRLCFSIVPKCQDSIPCCYPSPQSLHQGALQSCLAGGPFSGFGHWFGRLQKGEQQPVGLPDGLFLLEVHHERSAAQLDFGESCSLRWNGQSLQSSPCGSAELPGLNVRNHPDFKLC